MAGTWIRDQDQIEVIQEVLKLKIRGTGRKITPACMILCKPLKLSHLTLINILKGSVSVRTRNRMIRDGWFTYADLNKKKTTKTHTHSQARSTNDAKQQAAREKSAYRRGFGDGHRIGFADGQKDGRHYGYKDGYKEGYKDGAASSKARPKAKKTDDTHLPVDKLQSLFNMNTDRGAAQGETVAARVAVGKVLSRWIKTRFGQTVEVKLS